MKKINKAQHEEKPNLFDLDYTEDLPEKLNKDLEEMSNPRITHSSLILKLFDFKERLTVKEAMVGLYRGYKIEKSKIRLKALLTSLAGSKKINKVNKDVYERI